MESLDFNRFKNECGGSFSAYRAANFAYKVSGLSVDYFLKKWKEVADDEFAMYMFFRFDLYFSKFENSLENV